MFGQAFPINCSHVSAVRHAFAVPWGVNGRGMKACPCYLTLGRVDDDNREVDAVSEAGVSLFNLHSIV